jgi:hypothetical protein
MGNKITFINPQRLGFRSFLCYLPAVYRTIQMELSHHMKIKISVLFLSFLNVGAGKSPPPKAIPNISQNILIGPSAPVQSLISLTGYKGTPANLAEAVAYTQKVWLRSQGKERHEMDIKKIQGSKDQILSLFKELKLTDPVLPLEKEYDSALVLGATGEAMQDRFAYLYVLWTQHQVRFKKIYFLVGQRLLYKEKIEGSLKISPDLGLPLLPNWSQPKKQARTETDAAQWLVAQVDMKKAFGEIPVEWIDTPIQEGLRRPNTEDTLLLWRKTAAPQAGTKVLVISQNPFVGYQNAVVAGVLQGSKIHFETVGSGNKWIAKEQSYALVLDSLARWLYQTQKNMNTP